MAKSVKTGQETLEGLGKLFYLKASKVDFVKIVVCTTALEPKTNPSWEASLDRSLCSAVACRGREQRRGAKEDPLKWPRPPRLPLSVVLTTALFSVISPNAIGPSCHCPQRVTGY